MSGLYYPEDDRLVVGGITCKQSDQVCLHPDVGVMAWRTTEATCSNTYGQIYSGMASTYTSRDNNSEIVVIANDDIGSYAGKFFW